jgi:hypothetical protein
MLNNEETLIYINEVKKYIFGISNVLSSYSLTFRFLILSMPVEVFLETRHAH